jgi:hypothetical protein
MRRATGIGCSIVLGLGLALSCNGLLRSNALAADWPDVVGEFPGGHSFALVRPGVSFVFGGALHYYSRTGTSAPGSTDSRTLSWSRLGKAYNGSCATNAIERIGQQFFDDSTTDCLSSTTTVFRYRQNAIAGYGDSCTTYTGTLIATAIRSEDSCTSPKVVSDLQASSVDITLDFATEASITGLKGYRVRLTQETSLGGTPSTGTHDGCYTIDWVTNPRCP